MLTSIKLENMIRWFSLNIFYLLKCAKRRLWFFVSFRILFSDKTKVRIFNFFVAQSANFFSRIYH